MINKMFKLMKERIKTGKKSYVIGGKGKRINKLYHRQGYLCYIIIFWIAISLWYCSKAANEIIYPELQEKKVRFTGRVTGTFMRKPLSGVKVSIEIENEDKGETTTDANGFYSIILDHKPTGAKAPKIIYKAKGGNIRFPRETGYYGTLIKDQMEYDIDCVENYGDGANFDLNLYRRLNVDTEGNPSPTFRFYPDFPKIYILKEKDIANWKVNMVIEGIKRFIQLSRGAIPSMEITIVTDEQSIPKIEKNIIHRWVNFLIRNTCAITNFSSDPHTYYINSSQILYLKKMPCDATVHEMRHAMMSWKGLDNIKYNEYSDYHFSLQAYFTYKRYPKHTFENTTDKDFKP